MLRRDWAPETTLHLHGAVGFRGSQHLDAAHPRALGPALPAGVSRAVPPTPYRPRLGGSQAETYN